MLGSLFDYYIAFLIQEKKSNQLALYPKYFLLGLTIEDFDIPLLEKIHPVFVTGGFSEEVVFKTWAILYNSVLENDVSTFHAISVDIMGHPGFGKDYNEQTHNIRILNQRKIPAAVLEKLNVSLVIGDL